MILVTGGAGYIGSHTVVELIEAGYPLVVLDNLSNASDTSLARVEEITGQQIDFVEGDILDEALLSKLFEKYKFNSVIHFAGLKAVGESVAKPLKYYENNVSGTVNLLQVMQKFNCKEIVFSSSATVYGEPEEVPITEDFPLSATNSYGRSKLIIEEILGDLFKSDPNWKIALLRYFNPIGAHPSGLIGEDPNGVPNNLLPYISQVAIGKLEKLSVFGDDYSTEDGTGVRDYLHVVDLAKGHVKALQAFKEHNFVTVNLGTGKGYSVLEMIKAFEVAFGGKIEYQIEPRRLGDIAECFANPEKALQLLNWKAELNLSDMCQDAWNWQSKNPNGYN